MYMNFGEPRWPGSQLLHRGAQEVQVRVQACSAAPSPLTPNTQTPSRHKALGNFLIYYGMGQGVITGPVFTEDGSGPREDHF